MAGRLIGNTEKMDNVFTAYNKGKEDVQTGKHNENPYDKEKSFLWYCYNIGYNLNHDVKYFNEESEPEQLTLF